MVRHYTKISIKKNTQFTNSNYKEKKNQNYFSIKTHRDIHTIFNFTELLIKRFIYLHQMPYIFFISVRVSYLKCKILPCIQFYRLPDGFCIWE